MQTTSSAQSFLEELYRSSIGLSGFFDRVYPISETYSSYPLENVIQETDSRLRVELALAGFDRSEIKVYTENGKLYVEGTRQSKPDEKYLVRNIAQRSFRWGRVLQEQLQVDSVSFVNGILKITLNRHTPEHELRKEYTF
jgi:molecular chaperone IbpA